MTVVYDFDMPRLDGSEESLETYKGKVLLIVNLASRCGFTPQYKGLEALYKDLNDQGFEILGFPCNQFGSQEPGSSEDIQQFCDLNFGVTFPLFKKIEVNGDGAAPLYQFLKKEAPGLMGTKAIKWNFTKFLVNRDGKVIKRFAPNDTPEAIRKHIEKLL